MKVYAVLSVLLLALIGVAGFEQGGGGMIGLAPVMPYLCAICVLVALGAWLQFIVRARYTFKRRFHWFALGLNTVNAFAVLAFLTFTTLTMSSAGRTEGSTGRAVKVMTANLWNDPATIGAFVKHVNTVKPDIIFLQEAYEPWRSAIVTAFPDYLYVSECGPPQNCDVAILSRFPILKYVDDVCNGCAAAHLDMSQIDGAEKELLAVSVHLSRNDATHAIVQTSALKSLVRDWPGPVVLAGDLNLTPWDRRLRNFSEGLALKLSSGFGPTWPTPTRVGAPDFVRFSVPGVSIDHVFASPDWSRQGPVSRHDFGSDHYAVTVTLRAGS